MKTNKDEKYINDLIQAQQKLKEKDELLSEAVFLISAFSASSMLRARHPTMDEALEKRKYKILEIKSMEFLIKSCFGKVITAIDLASSDEKLTEFKKFIEDKQCAYMEQSLKK